MNMKKMVLCNIIVIREDVVFANYPVIGTDIEKVSARAEELFKQCVKENDEQIADGELEACVEDGYWNSEVDDVSVCLTWGDVLTENVLK